MELTAYHPFKSAGAKEKFLASYGKSAQKIWPIVSENKVVETSYGSIFVRVGGQKDSRPLVLLHGANANSLMWRLNIEALTTHFRTYAVDDIYGCGRSIDIRPISSADDYVTWLNELFDGLDLGSNINLMGMSYGGWLTSQYALRFPDRLDKIVLISPGATVLPLQLGFIVRFVLSSALHFHFLRRNLMFWTMADLVRKNEYGRRMVEEAVDNICMGLQCLKPRKLVRPTVLNDEELKSLKMPTLFLIGENEKIYSANKAVQRLNQVAPHIKTEIIPGAGHDLVFVQADLVNKKVIEFLKQT